MTSNIGVVIDFRELIDFMAKNKKMIIIGYDEKKVGKSVINFVEMIPKL